MNSKSTSNYEAAIAAGKTYLSEYQPIERCDLLALYAAAQEYRGERYFWRTPDETTSIVGLGWLATFSQPKLADFSEVRSLLKQAHYQPEAPFQAQLVGGFAFDEQAEVSQDWAELGAGLFALPEILVSKTGDQCGVYTVAASSEEQRQQKVAALQEKVASWLQANSDKSLVTETPAFQAQEELDVPQWLQAVEETVAAIRSTETPLKKVVLARRMKVETKQSIISAAVLQRLAQQQPNTYLFAIEHGGHVFAGATPERLLKATVDQFETVSIAGSAPRGKTKEEDEALAQALLADAKNTHEHQVVVDRLETALATLLADGFQSEARSVIKNRDIQHLFVPLAGQRKAGVNFLTAVQKLHPTPALGGEPKEAAVSWIRTHEPASRGMYGGPIGWLGIQEDIGEFAVAIRSGFFSGNQATLYAGCGIVADSDAESERQETRLKFQPMRRGILGDE